MEEYTCILFIIVEGDISYILWTLKDIFNISNCHFKEFFKNHDKIHVTYYFTILTFPVCIVWLLSLHCGQLSVSTLCLQDFFHLPTLKFCPH